MWLESALDELDDMEMRREVGRRQAPQAGNRQAGSGSTPEGGPACLDDDMAVAMI